MDDAARLDEQPARLEIVDDGLRDVVRRQPVEPVTGQHAARLVERGEHGEVVGSAELEVLGARTGRDVHDPRPLVERDVLPGDHAVDDTLLCGNALERPLVLEADELRCQRTVRTKAASGLRATAHHSPSSVRP